MSKFAELCHPCLNIFRKGGFLMDFEEISMLAKKCMEIGFSLPPAGNFETSDIYHLVQRKSLIHAICKTVFEGSPFDYFIQNTVHEDRFCYKNYIRFRLNKEARGVRFSQKAKVFMEFSVESDDKVYTLTIPVIRDNADMGLHGLFSFGEPTSMMEWLEYLFTIKEKESKKIKKWHLTFSTKRTKENLSESERRCLFILEDAALMKIAKLNIQRLKDTHPELVDDFDLIQSWSVMHIDLNNMNQKHNLNIDFLPEWNSYIDFAEWSRNNGYELGATLERIDSNGGFFPNNLRWNTETKRFPYINILEGIKSYSQFPYPERYYLDYETSRYLTQSQLNNLKITIDEVEKSVHEWEQFYGISGYILLSFHTFGLGSINSNNKIKPKMKFIDKPITIDGTTRTAKEWSELTGISMKTIVSRIRYGWKDEDIIKDPRSKAKNN